MNTTKLILAGAALLAVLLAGCSPDDAEQTTLDITQPEGPAALTRYVAIGNSLTAGFMDGGLIMNGQMASYPARIAGRLGYSFDSTSDDWFAQPLIAWPGVGSTDVGPAAAAGVLHWTGTTIDTVATTPLQNVPALLLATTYPTPYRNLGVPGATLLDATEALDSSTSQSPGNSYFDFILRNPTFGDVNMLDQAIAQGPTLATIWLGNNDVLGGATGGQPELGVNVTPPAAFAALLESVVAGMIDGVQARFGYEPHLVVANIPSITSIPYFVPKTLFDSVIGVDYPTVEDDVQFVRFPAVGLVSGGFSDPLPAEYTLTGAEVSVVETAVSDYNTAIGNLADEYGFTVANISGLLAGLDPATEAAHFLFLVGGGMTEEQAAAATVFSLDGIHPNNHGYTLVANAFIAAINDELGLQGDDALADVADGSPWDPTYPAPVLPAANVAIR